MRTLWIAALVVVACERPRGDVQRELEAQLAPVARPEPAGIVQITIGPFSTTIARDEASLEVIAKDTNGFDVIRTKSAARYEELRRANHRIDRIELRYLIKLGPGLASLKVVEDIVEAHDSRGVARLRTEPAFAVDANKAIRKLVPSLTDDGVVWSADARDLVPPIAIDPAWIATKSAPRGVFSGTATTLSGNRVVVVEPISGKTLIYDDATSSWTNGPSMSRSRNVRAIALDDGRILVAGGGGEDPTTADLYNPTTNTWKKTVSSPIAYGSPIGAALKGDKVLLVGQAGATVYDAAADTWVTTGNPTVQRRPNRAVRMFDGRIMVLGGIGASGEALASVEIYDSTLGTFSAASVLSVPRAGGTQQALSDNRVIVFGGIENSDTGSFLPNSEIYDPTAKTWSLGPKLSAARLAPSSIVLPDGRILVVGGSSDALLASTEMYDPAKKTFVASGSLSAARAEPSLAFIDAAKKRVLAIGGYNGGASDAVDIFSFEASGNVCTAAAECTSGNCVDGVCCEKSKCAADETCGGAKAPGVCTKKQGVVCTAAAECGSGFCVDGACCDRACDSVCEACDVATSKGVCATLSPGEAPRGLHGKCPGEGACAALCGGSDAKSCTLLPGATTPCGQASCKDGIETSASTCDGKGACTPPVTTKCEAYACAERSCKRACAVDTDCASGFSCDARSGRCVFGAKCDGDHTVSVPGSASIDCTPFKCAGSDCIKKCGGTNDCVAGTTCDTASGGCIVAGGSGGDGGGGCSYGARTPMGSVAALLLMSVLSRRRSR